MENIDMINAKTDLESSLPAKLPPNSPNFKKMSVDAVEVLIEQKLDYTAESLERLDKRIDKS